LSRTKGALGKKTLAKMGLLTNGLDKYKVNHQNGGNNDQNTRKNGGNNKPKVRIRRTKAQLIAAGYYDKDKPKQDKPKHRVKVKDAVDKTKEILEANKKGKNKDVDRTHLFIKGGKSVDEISTRAIQKAQERGDTNWEQDFRNDYEQGQKIYYVEINELCHTKELLELYVGTVYSKVMICWIDRGESHPIGIKDADKIFREEKEARKYYSKVRVK
jgi:hypothetical protein